MPANIVHHISALALTYDKIVDGKYNILVQVAEYDWKLDSSYTRVADAFAKNKDVLVASMEASGDNENFVKDKFDSIAKTDLPKTFW